MAAKSVTCINLFDDDYINRSILNAATAIIMTPIAIAVTQQMGFDPRAFVFAVAFAASASFITPVGYQTNLMVYGPGGYKFSDYIRVGFPLAFIFWVMAVFFLPVIWPI